MSVGSRWTDTKADTNAHHIIPQSLGHPLVDFMCTHTEYLINDTDNNRIDLPTQKETTEAIYSAQHNGQHPAYDRFVREQLTAITVEVFGTENVPNNPTPEQLEELVEKVRGLQAFLADSLTPTVTADGQVRYSEFILNASDPRAPAAPDGKKTDVIYNAFYADWDWERIKETDIYRHSAALVAMDGGIRKNLGPYFATDKPGTEKVPAPTDATALKALTYREIGITHLGDWAIPLHLSRSDLELRIDYNARLAAAAALVDEATAAALGENTRFTSLESKFGTIQNVSLGIIAYGIWRIAEDYKIDVDDLLSASTIDFDITEMGDDLMAETLQLLFELAALTVVSGSAGVVLRLTMDAKDSIELMTLAYELLKVAHPELAEIEQAATEFFQIETHLRASIQEYADAHEATSSITINNTASLDPSETLRTLGTDENDVIQGGGTVEIHGGDGDDLIFHTGAARVEGGNGNDILVADRPQVFSQGESLDPDNPNAASAAADAHMELDGGPGDDVLFVVGGENTVVRGGTGADTFRIWSYNTAIDLGDDDDADTLWYTPGSVVANAGAEDRVTFFGIIELSGGIAAGSEETVAIDGTMPFIVYQLTTDGHLVISTPFMSNTALAPEDPETPLTPFEQISMLVLDYQGGPSGGSIAQDDTTLNIYVANFEAALLNGDAFHREWTSWADVYTAYLKTHGIVDANDPLVIDLDGDGIELTSVSISQSYFDLTGDGFAENTGWVRSDDALLVLDVNGNGQIDDISELFGAPGVAGFDELASHDSNGDGQIDEADAVFTDLMVWQDHNQDGVSDAGELRSLDAVGIASIELSHQARDETTNSGHARTGLGTVTLTSGETRDVHEMIFDTAPHDTKYLGDATVADFAADLPEARGYGQLTDLSVAASNDAAVHNALRSVEGTLDAVDLETLAEQTEPVLRAWAAAQPTTSEQMAVRVAADGMLETARWDETATAYLTGDGSALTFSADTPGTTNADGWRIEEMWVPGDTASARGGVTYAEITVVDHPYAADDYSLWVEDLDLWVSALDWAAAGGNWLAYTGPSGADLGAFETAYLAQNSLLPSALSRVDVALADYAARVSGLDFAGFDAMMAGSGALPSLTVGEATGLLFEVSGIMDEQAERLALRLAAQDGLAPFFAGLPYDPETDSFNATGPEGLRPLYQAIFAEAGQAPDSAAYLADWGTLLPSVYADFNRHGAAPLSDGFLLANVVAAHSATPTGLGLRGTASALGMDTDRVLFETEGHTTGDDAGTGSNRQIFVLEAGDASFDGGQGSDTYVVGPNWGHDIIDDREAALSDRGSDTLRFATATVGDLTVERDGLDLLITHGTTGDTLRIVDQFEGRVAGLEGTEDFSDDTGMFEIVFADGTHWLPGDIAAAVSTIDTAATTVIGTPSADVIEGGAGDDILSGGRDSDLYYFSVGDGDDIVREANDAATLIHMDMIVFGEGLTAEDALFRRILGTQDLEISFATGDSVVIENQFQSANTGVAGVVWQERIEVFYFDGAYPMTWEQVADRALSDASSDGDDAIVGSYRRDVLDGGLGNDELIGGSGDDVYRFALGYGQDTIIEGHSGTHGENGDALFSGEGDEVQFGAGIAPEDIEVRRIDDETVALDIAGNSDSLILQEQYRLTASGVFDPFYFNQVERFAFYDGTVWTDDDLRARYYATVGTSGDERIEGFDAQDTIYGSAGNDVLAGGGRSDTYIWSLGYGDDRIEEDRVNILYDDQDRVEFQGLASTDVSVDRSGDDLIFTLLSTTETLTIAGQFDHRAIGGTWSAVEEFVFTDTTLAAADFDEGIVQGGTGDDTLVGSTSAETFIGGTGNDRIEGDGNSDTYLFARGQGNDTIYEYRDNVLLPDLDTVVFQDIAFASVSVTRTERDLIFTLDSDETLVIEDHYVRFTTGGSWRAVERFEFSDVTLTAADFAPDQIPTVGTSADETLIGTDYGETVIGSGGNDRLEGRGGSDIYLWGRGEGSDTILDDRMKLQFEADDRVVLEGLVPADITLARTADDLLVTIQDTGERLTIERYFRPDIDYWYGIETIAFADGTEWTRSDVEPLVIGAVPQIIGTGAAETLTGTTDDEAIDGRGGADTLRGEGGSDVYHWRRGDGDDQVDDTGLSSGDADQLWIEDAVLGEATFSTGGTGGADVLITIGAETLTLMGQLGTGNYGIETVRFADGQTLDRAAIAEAATMTWGTAGDDTLSGANTADGLAGGLGNDTLSGGDASDVYLFRRGDGQDVIDDNGFGDTDRVQIRGYTAAETTLARSSDTDLLLSFQGTTDTILIRHTLDGTFQDQIEVIRFEDGTEWSAADIRAMVLDGEASDGDDLLTGFEPDDILVGGLGNDTISGGDGGDTYRFTRGDGDDVIEDNGFGDTDVVEITGYTAGELLFAHTGPDLVITFAGTNDRITIRHALDESLQDQVEQVKLGDGTEWSIDQIRADILANATTSGDDTITGFEADDTIEGGLGDDLLSGADGSDTYIFRAGDGIDRIHDQGFFDNDRVEIIGHTADETSVARAGVNGDDLILAFANGDRIKIENTLDGDFTDRVERVAFSDGTEWTTDQLADRFDGLGADVTHAGSVGADTLIGSGGDDVMVGGAGADMFVFDLGGSDDAIRDFAPEDRIDLRYTGIASFAEVTAASSQDGTDVVIALGNGTSVRLTGVSLADLAEDDFLF